MLFILTIRRAWWPTLPSFRWISQLADLKTSKFALFPDPDLETTFIHTMPEKYLHYKYIFRHSCPGECPPLLLPPPPQPPPPPPPWYLPPSPPWQQLPLPLLRPSPHRYRLLCPWTVLALQRTSHQGDIYRWLLLSILIMIVSFLLLASRIMNRDGTPYHGP